MQFQTHSPAQHPKASPGARRPIIPQSDDISARILRYVGGKDYHPQRARLIARDMGLTQHEYGDFRAAVKTLMRSGRVILGGSNCIMLPRAAETITGTFRGHQRGFGFVVPESPADHGDLFIPPGASLTAITGDTVVARITRRGKRGDEARVEGEIIEILKRGQSRFVGELVREGKQWMILPDGRTLHTPILIPDARSSRARAGDHVVAEITEFPSENKPARGVIVEVLGRRGDPGIDILGIVHQYHLPIGFPEEVLESARKSVQRCNMDQQAARREDLRSEVIVTIDPDDAKDYDDAISLRRLGRSGFELGVHIADVSSFVRPNTPLDKEARQRGNSVYLPRHVIPMLPEALSNGLCSLQEGEPRLAKSAFIEYDAKGHRKATRFANTIIRSTRRLTYGEATAIIDGNDARCDPEVVALLKDMDQIARLIQKRRLAAGMIVLDLPEIELVFNDDGEVTDVTPADTSFSHTIIEMFMVEANEVVAELLTNLDVPHLRRIHPEPPPDAQRKLTEFLRVLGRPIPRRLEREDMIRLLNSVRGTPQAFAINLAVLRSMAQAEYSPRLIGHFALASRHYAHFTSPIRRYPDLEVHRLLDMYLTGQLKTKRARQAAPSTDTLTEVGRRCTFTERHAEGAEREARLVKILRLLEHRVGDIEEGVVTGVTNVGIFIQVRRYLIDGLIRFADLADDWWDINPRAGCVVGQRSGRRIGIGDLLTVQIAGVDIANRELDLMLVETRRKSAEKKPPKSGRPGGGKVKPSRKTDGTRASRRPTRARRGRRR